MVKPCNIYDQSVQLINYGQVWFQKYYHAYEHLYISIWANCATMLEVINKLINHYVYTQMRRYLHKGTKYTSRPW